MTAEVRVAVLGAGGTIAPALVHDLAESDEVSSLELMDLDADRAQAVADAHGPALVGSPHDQQRRAR